MDITLNFTQCIRACFSCCFLSLELESQCHSYILAEICCISWNRQVLIEEGEGKAKDLGVMFDALPGMKTLSSAKQEDMVDVNLRSGNENSSQSQVQAGGSSC